MMGSGGNRQWEPTTDYRLTIDSTIDHRLLTIDYPRAALVSVTPIGSDSAGREAASTVARCAATIVESACTLSDASPPPWISAESAPMQPSAARIGATSAPGLPPGRASTICICPVR